MAGADGGFTIKASGIAEARKAIRARMVRAADLRPALRVVAQEIEKRTDDSFRNSKSQFGEKFDELAESTKLGRLRRLKGANRLTKKSAAERARLEEYFKLSPWMSPQRRRAVLRANNADVLSGSAKKFRAKLLADGGMKPLIDTGRARKSQHCDVTSPTTLRWTAVGYLGPHLTGGQRGGKLGRPPMRNVSVFVHSGGGDFDFLGGGGGGGWRLDASMQAYLNRAVSSHITTGKVTT